MINLRFHIVSLVAVFLALAIGIAVGATVVDQGLVSQSQRRISALDQTLERRATEIAGLKSQVRELESFGKASESRAIDARLTATSVLVLSVGPVDEAVARQMQSTIRSSGGRLIGSIEVGSALALDTSNELERARLALNGASTRADTIRFLVRQSIARGIAKPLEPNGLRSLVGAGFLRSLGVEGVPFPEKIPFGTRVLFVSDATSPGDELMKLVSDIADAGAGVVVVGDNTPMVGKVRTLTALASRVSSIDNFSSRAGRVGLIYALEDLSRSRFGHYGTHEDAQRLVPGV